MKLRSVALAVVIVGAGVSTAFFSCGKPKSEDDDAKVASSDADGGDEQDVTQAFTLSIEGASVDFPADSFEEGGKVSFEAGTQPAEFAPEGKGVTGASVV